MTEQAAPVATPETPPAAPALSKYERAMAALVPAAPPAAPAEPAAEVTPAAAPETPPAPESDLEKARQQQAYLKYQREAVEAKKRAAELEERFKPFAGKDPAAIAKALKEQGVTLEALAKAVVDEPDPTPETPEQKRIRELEERIEAAEREKAQQKLSEVDQQNVAYVTELLGKEAEKYPGLAGFKAAPRELVKRFNAAVDRDGEPADPLALLHEIATGFNASVMSDVDNILSSDAALKAYITRPDIKARVLGFLGAKHSAGPASSEGENSQSKGAPTAIPSTASATSGTRAVKPSSRDERFAQALGLLKKGG
jgi:hypothetical protein